MGLDNPLHVAFLVLLLLVVFGARRLPEIGRSLGTGMRAFRDSITGNADAAGDRISLDAGSAGPGLPQPAESAPVPAGVRSPEAGTGPA